MQILAGLLIGFLISALLGGALLAWLIGKSRRLERRTAEAERLAELGLLTGGLAHELKNPLSTVQLNLQLLREDLEARAADEESKNGEPLPYHRMVRRLHGLNNETNRLRGILDDFLRYAGRLEVEAKPTDLKRLVEELLDFLAPQAHLARVRLESSCREAQVVAEVDPGLIKQALLNLVLNAIQHSPGGGTVTVALSSARGGRGGRQEVQLEVIDKGAGIAPEEQARVFEPYFTRRKGGTGLGLATTRRIVQAHGGAISVESTPGEGSRFIVRLPVHDGDRSALPTAPAANASAASEQL